MIKGSIKNRLNKLKNAYPDKQKIILLSYNLCKTFGWDYFTLMKQPIPFINAMISGMRKEQEEQEKATKKK